MARSAPTDHLIPPRSSVNIPSSVSNTTSLFLWYYCLILQMDKVLSASHPSSFTSTHDINSISSVQPTLGIAVPRHTEQWALLLGSRWLELMFIDAIHLTFHQPTSSSLFSATLSHACFCNHAMILRNLTTYWMLFLRVRFLIGMFDERKTPSVLTVLP